jgi:uncharacterized protein (TIGR04222 family)
MFDLRACARPHNVAMTTVAADTWGISGSWFLLYFAVAAVLAFFLSGFVRRALYGGAVQPGWEPTAEQIAYFSGGPRQAVLAALAGLRAEQAVASTGGTLTVTGRVTAGPSPLTWAVYQAAQRGARAGGLEKDPALKPALADLRDVLVSQGWLLTSGRRFAIATIGSLPVLAVVGLGIARIYAGIANDKSVGLIIALTLIVGLVAIVLLLGTGRQSRAGQRALAAMRARHGHLSPRSDPSLATYGATGAAMSVALFGAVALWSFDPAFATDVAALRASSGGGGSSDSGSGSSSCSGGGGCGGGGGGCGG